MVLEWIPWRYKVEIYSGHEHHSVELWDEFNYGLLCLETSQQAFQRPSNLWVSSAVGLTRPFQSNS